MPNIGAPSTAMTPEAFSHAFIATLKKISVNPKDQVLKRHPVLDLFKKNASSQTGTDHQVNLVGGEDTNTVLTDASGTYTPNVSGDTLGSAVYGWSNVIITPVRVRWLDLQKNAGPEGQIKLMKRALTDAENGHAKKLATFLHARRWNGTADEKVAGQFHSLDELVGNYAYDADSSGTAAVPAWTVGGITAADADHYWNATRREIAADSGTDIRKAFRQIANDIYVETADATGHVTHIVCGRDVFEEFEDSFDDKLRYIGTDDGQTYFTAIKFGDLEVRLDPDCPPKRAYFLNESSLEAAYLNGQFMNPQEPQQVTNTLDYVVPIVSVMSFGVNERRANGVLLRPSTAGGDA